MILNTIVLATQFSTPIQSNENKTNNTQALGDIYGFSDVQDDFKDECSKAASAEHAVPIVGQGLALVGEGICAIIDKATDGGNNFHVNINQALKASSSYVNGYNTDSNHELQRCSSGYGVGC